MCEQLVECLLGVSGFTDMKWKLIMHQCHHIECVIMTLVHVPNGPNEMSRKQMGDKNHKEKTFPDFCINTMDALTRHRKINFEFPSRD